MLKFVLPNRLQSPFTIPGTFHSPTVRLNDLKKRNNCKVRNGENGYLHAKDACNSPFPVKHESESAELIRKETELIRKETELIRKEAELIRKETELTRKESELIRKESELTRKEAELTRKEAELIRNEAEIEEADILQLNDKLKNIILDILRRSGTLHINGVLDLYEELYLNSFIGTRYNRWLIFLKSREETARKFLVAMECESIYDVATEMSKLYQQQSKLIYKSVDVGSGVVWSRKAFKPAWSAAMAVICKEIYLPYDIADGNLAFDYVKKKAK